MALKDLFQAAREGNVNLLNEALKGGANVNAVGNESDLTAFWMAVNHAAANKEADKNRGYVETLKALLWAGADANANGKELGPDAECVKDMALEEFELEKDLHDAASAGDLDRVKELLDNEKVNLNARRLGGKTALMLAAMNGHAGVVQALIDAKADVTAVDNEQKTALMLAAMNGHADVVRALIDAGADINAINNEQKTALIIAAERGNAVIVQELIAKKEDVVDGSGKVIQQIDLNAIDKGGRTALTAAAEGGHEGIVRALIDAGADVNAKANYGWTALMSAISFGKLGVVQVLLEKAVSQIHFNVKDSGGKTALMLAIDKGNAGIVQVLVAVEVIKLNEKDNHGKTALMLAIDKGDEVIVQALIAAGADVNAKTDSGWAALTLAIEKGNAGIVQVLIAAGADVNVKGRFGYSPLMLAVEKGNAGIVQALIAARADVNVKDSGGKTALMLAIEKGYAVIVQALIDAGADVNVKGGIYSPLMLAIEKGDAGIQVALLKKIRSTENYVAVLNENLIWAAKQGYADVVGMLISAGADVNAADRLGWTALMWAFYYSHSEASHSEAAQVLIRNGAKVDVERIRPFYSTEDLEQGIDANVKKAIAAIEKLFQAVEENNVDLLNKAIKEGAYVDTVSGIDHYTPLIHAAEKGHLKVVNALIGSGANVNATSKDGKTALIAAAEKGHLKVVNALIKAGAKVDTKRMGELGLDGIIRQATSENKGSDEELESSKEARSYPKTQVALCLASAAIPAGLVFLLAGSLLPVLATAAGGIVAALVLTTVYKDGVNDVAHSVYNKLGIAQDESAAITVS
jgi:ankyrin repeat protein